MKWPRFRLRTLCLLVVISALYIKLTMTVNTVAGILMVTTPTILLGPRVGVLLDRRRGGSGAAGGAIAGAVAGTALAVFLTIILVRGGSPFSPGESTFLLSIFVAFLTASGWFLGRPLGPEHRRGGHP